MTPPASVPSGLAQLAAQAAFGERHGHLSPESLDVLRADGLLDLWRPAALGGREVHPVTLARTAESVATADAAAAWAIHSASASWFDLRGASTRLLVEITDSAGSPMLAETFNGAMSAEACPGGYRISGTSVFASNCRIADWIGHTATCGNDFLLLFHPAGALEIVDDWHALGLRGSSSNSIRATNLFVPAHRAIRLNGPRQMTPAFETALYRAPEGLVPVAVPATALGIVARALDALTELARQKTPFASSTPLRERTLAQHHYGQALALYRGGRALLHDTLTDCYARLEAPTQATLQHKADLFLAYAHAIQSARKAIDLIARAAATTGIREPHPIERGVRDLQVIAQHAFGTEGRFATVAQAYWDLDVDFPLLAMD